MGISNTMETSSIEEFIFDFIDFIWEVNAEGIYTYVAGNVEGVLGYKAEEILGKSPFDFMPENEAKKIAEIFISIVQNTEPIIDLINWNKHKDGSDVCLLTNGKPFFSKEGNFLGYRGVDKDITKDRLEKVHSENQLKSLIQWSSTNVNGKKDTIKEALEISAKGLDFHRVSYWEYDNKKACILCMDMYEAEIDSHSSGMELYEKDFPNYFKALKQKEALLIENARVDERTREFIEVYLKPNEIYSMLDVPVFWHGELLGVVCHEHKFEKRGFHEQDMDFALAISDSISKAIEIEQTKVLKDALFQKTDELSIVNKNLQLALDAASAGIFIFDIRNNDIFWDEKSMKIFGTDKKSFQSNYESWASFVLEEEIENLNKQVQEQIENGEIMDIRYKINYQDKSIKHIWAIGSIIRDKDKKPLYISGLHFDETQKVELASKLEEMKNRAITASNAKSDFLSSMSHEIRTPLNAILGFTRLSKKEKNISSEVSRNLQIIENSSEHLLDIINQVLDLSKIEAGKLELNENDIDLKVLIDDVNQMIKMPVKEKNLEYICDVNIEENCFVHTDDSKIKQVLINLLGNAVKFTQSGHVKFGVSCSLADNALVDVNFIVEDSGRGISKNNLEMIFEPFTQTDLMDQDQGSGLGLSISKSIIQLLGGNISVSSEVNKGTKFTIKMQLERVETVGTELVYPSVKSLRQKYQNTKVLVVDDIMVNRLLLRTFLEEAGFDVCEAEDGEKAIQVALEENPVLIWMDLKMPIMDGRTATQLLKKKHSYKGRILALSANVMNKDTEENKIFDNFLLKPFDENKMFDLMREYLGIEYIYKEEE